MCAPRILLIDIETTPLKMWAWGVYETNALEVLEDSFILCFAYKWLGEKKIHTVALPDFPSYKRRGGKKNDRALTKSLLALLNEADIVVAHNGDRFDIKKINTRLLVHRFPPPSPFQTIDTLKVSKKNFAFYSNKLDSIGNILSIGRKLHHTGKALWLACMDGDMSAWALMLDYNKQDVRLLDDTHELFRPWHATYPNLNAFTGGNGCPKCQSTDLERRGEYVSKTRRYQRYRCRDCKGWTKGEIVKNA